MKYIKWISIVTCFIIFPIVLEKLLFIKKIFFVSIKTNFTNFEWFSFWGSYLGAIGTLVLGLVALKQNKTLATANKELDSIQKSYFDSITRPVFKIGTETTFIYEKKADVYDYLSSNIDTMYPLVLTNFSKDYKTGNCWYTRLQLPLLSSSDIPLMDFEVSNLAWRINGRKYEFENIVVNRTSKLAFKGEFNLCNICIIYPDLLNQNHELRIAGEDIQLYIESSFNRTFDSRESRISMEITLRNQLNVTRKFHVEIDFEWMEKYTLLNKKYFIMPYDE